MTKLKGIKSSLSKLAYNAGYHVVPRWQMRAYPFVKHLKELFASRQIDCVLDVGGNKGQYAQFLREEVGYRGHIISFEPIDYNFAVLQERSKGDPKWDCARMALGASEGSLTLNVMAEDSFSSFLQPLDDQPFAQNKVASAQDVAVHRLDTWLAAQDLPFRRIYLKLDTQGFDLEVFKGASGVLDRIVAMQSELAFSAIYKQMPTFDEVLPVYMQSGFRVSNMFAVSIENFAAVEFDCILVRADRD